MQNGRFNTLQPAAELAGPRPHAQDMPAAAYRLLCCIALLSVFSIELGVSPVLVLATTTFFLTVWVRGLTESAAQKSRQAEVENGQVSLRQTIDCITDGCFIVDKRLAVVGINAAALQWFAAEENEILGKHAFEISDEIGLDTRQAIRSATARGLSIVREERSTLYPDRWLNIRISPHGEGACCVFRDITDRRAAQETLKKSMGLLSSALDAMSAQVAILDEHGRILVVNESWRKCFRLAGDFTYSDGIGEKYLALKCLHPVQPSFSSYRRGISAVLKNEQEQFKGSFRSRVNGEDRWYHLSAARFHTRDWTRFLIAREDITEMRMARRAVDGLAMRLVTLQEKEQQRFAGELHDSTSQYVTAANLNLMALRKNEAISENGSRLIDEVEMSLEEVQKQVRSVSYLLYPRNLESDGLAATLLRFIDGFSQRTQIKVAVKIDADCDGLPMALQRALLRIVQEAFANVHRHATANKIIIYLAAKNGSLNLHIADNGKGFQSQNPAVPLREGVGIPGMRARVHQFDGTLRILSGARGTRLSVQIPIRSRVSNCSTAIDKCNRLFPESALLQ